MPAFMHFHQAFSSPHLHLDTRPEGYQETAAITHARTMKGRQPPRSYIILLALILSGIASVSKTAAAGRAGKSEVPGGYSPIKSANNSHVQEIGRYAVSEHNKQAGQSLVFVRVVAGEEQVVAGVNYKLVIEAKDGAASHQYEAMVYEKAWENYKRLTFFNLKA